MKLLWIIVRKDFCRLRGWLALWLLFVVAKLAVGCWILFFGGERAMESRQLEQIMTGFTVGEMVMTFLIAALLVHEDNLVDPQAFWLTRPISNARLLAAKLLGVVVLLGLPVIAVTLPWWQTAGFSMKEMAIAASLILSSSLVAVIPAMLVAAMTNTIKRMIVWSVILVAVFLLCIARFSAISGLNSSPFLILAVFTGIIVHQFLRRQLPVSIALTAAGFAFAIFFGRKANERAREFSRPDNNIEKANTVTLDLKNSSVLLRAKSSRSSPSFEDIVIKGHIDGVPRGTAVQGKVLQQTLRWPDGMELNRQTAEFSQIVTSSNEALSLPEELPDEETQQWIKKESFIFAPPTAGRSRRMTAGLNLKAESSLRPLQNPSSLFSYFTFPPRSGQSSGNPLPLTKPRCNSICIGRP